MCNPTKLLAAALVFLSLCPAPGLSQDAMEILRKVGDTYANFRSYDFAGESQMTIEVDGVKYRMTLPQAMARGDAPDLPLSFQFQRSTWQKADSADRVDHPHIGFSPPGGEIYDFARLPKGVKSARILREESLQANGKSTSCYLIEVLRSPHKVSSEDAVPAPQTFWIDKVTYLVLRLSFRTFTTSNNFHPSRTMDWVTTFSSYQLNEPPPQWLVEGRKNYDQQMAALSSQMIGTQAPDFKLLSLDGLEVSLAGLRDKVVLLDFWGTWCAPCRAELPVLAKLENEWAPKGLVVLRITEEPPEIVRDFLQKSGQNFPTLVNGESVSHQYGVPGIPTLVLIDRMRKIAAYDVKLLTDRELQDRLRKVGIE